MTTPLPVPSDRRAADADADRAWATAVRAGDDAAFEAMFRHYYQPLVRFAARFLAETDEAEDVVQAVFERILERRTGWDVHGSLRTYLYTGVRNAALSRLRARGIRRRLEPQVLARIAPEGSAGPRREWADAAQAGAELSEAMRRAIDRLPPRTGQAFELRFVHGLSYAEVAAVMEIALGTVNVHITNAIKLLRVHLAPYAPVLLFLPSLSS